MTQLNLLLNMLATTSIVVCSMFINLIIMKGFVSMWIDAHMLNTIMLNINIFIIIFIFVWMINHSFITIYPITKIDKIVRTIIYSIIMWLLIIFSFNFNLIY